MAPDKIESVAKHLKEGCGIRETSRLVGVSKSGVTSIAVRLGLHAHALHDERIVGLDVQEAQFDEKWAFVGKKQKHCDPSNPDDDSKGDQWDHTAIDVESRVVTSLVIGKRTAKNTKKVVADFAARTQGVAPALTTSDDCSTYPEALEDQYGDTVVPERTGKPGRPCKPRKKWPKGAAYATVKKTYKKGKVAKNRQKLVHGNTKDLDAALEASSSSTKINTAFIERQNGTDRTHNGNFSICPGGSCVLDRWAQAGRREEELVSPHSQRTLRKSLMRG